MSKLKTILFDHHSTSYLHRKHKGFAITLEVLLSIVIIVSMIAYSGYIVKVMDGERMLTTLVSSAGIEASRWGKDDSPARHLIMPNKPYRISDEYTTKARTELPDFNPTIQISNSSDASGDQIISATVVYEWPSFMNTNGKLQTVNGTVNPITVGSGHKINVKMKSLMGEGVLNEN